MCGITYIENGNTKDIVRALGDITHRGPDSQNSDINVRGAIGATRLAIVDVQRGEQPMTTSDGRYTIAFNGEVYNHQELRKKLEEDGQNFRTNCDTEVVLNSVAEKGDGAPCDFDGQFSYVMRDNKTGNILGARDQFGIRPFYFGQGTKGLVVGSEIPVLLNQGVSGENIRKLPQGCSFEYNPRTRGTKIRRYYDIRDHICTEVSNSERLYSLLEEAVKKRVPEEVEHATILSGIDSSTVAFLADRQGKKPKMTYTVATDLNSRDIESARILTSDLGIENRVGLIDEDYVIENIENVVRAMASPLYFPMINTFPALKLAEMAKEDEVKVIITGSGSDETNIGYDYIWELCDPRFLKDNFLELVYNFGEHEALREDRIFSSRGLEGRVPFLDKNLVEYVLSTPFSDRLPRMNVNSLKTQLKNAMRGKLPDSIVNREKEALYRSTGMIPLVARVADRLMSDSEYQKYLENLKGTEGEKQVRFCGKPAAIFHREWARQFPELANVELPKFGYIPNQDDLEGLSKHWVNAGGGVYVKGWNGGIK